MARCIKIRAFSMCKKPFDASVVGASARGRRRYRLSLAYFRTCLRSRKEQIVSMFVHVNVKHVLIQAITSLMTSCNDSFCWRWDVSFPRFRTKIASIIVSPLMRFTFCTYWINAAHLAPSLPPPRSLLTATRIIQSVLIIETSRINWGGGKTTKTTFREARWLVLIPPNYSANVEKLLIVHKWNSLQLPRN
jgi:hypothetical protein